MERINSWDELKKLRENIAAEGKPVLAVGMATCGVAAGARDIAGYLGDEISKRGLDVSVVSTGCCGFCYAEPMVEVRMPGKPPVKYGFVTEKLARDIVNKHVMKNEEIGEFIITQEVTRP